MVVACRSPWVTRCRQCSVETRRTSLESFVAPGAGVLGPFGVYDIWPCADYHLFEDR